MNRYLPEIGTDIWMRGVRYMPINLQSLARPLPRVSSRVPSNISQWIKPYDMAKAAGLLKPPRVAVALHRSSPIYGPKIIGLLEATGASPHVFDIDLLEIDPANLASEVEESLLSARAKRNESTSIPLELLRRAKPGSIVQRIYEIIEPEVTDCEGLALLGGPDIAPVFYDPATKPSGHDQSRIPDYRRTVAEIASVVAALKAGSRVLGTCRGAQMLNIIHGGTLKNVGSQVGWQNLTPTTSLEKGEEVGGMSEGFRAYSCHHQACDVIAPGLRVVLEHNDVLRDQVIPKLILGEKIVGVQFHPEECSTDDPPMYSQSMRVYELFYNLMSSHVARAESSSNKPL